MHVFDLQHTLLAQHAQHIVLVHFPIALVFVALLFDLLALRKPDDSWSMVSYYNLTVAAALVVPVLVTGLLAWRWQLEGTPLRGTLRLHLVGGLLSSLFIVLSWWSAQRRRSRSRRIAVEAITVAIVAATAHLGGVVAGLVN